jgi:hypothetical protein
MQPSTKNYWGEEHNRKRRRRYATDTHYRAAAQERSREAYRKRKSVILDDCRERLPVLDHHGHYRTAGFPDGQARKVLSFTAQEVGKFLNRSAVSMQRWIKDGRWPAPVLDDLGPGRAGKLYSYAEVHGMCEAYGEHSKNRALQE